MAAPPSVLEQANTALEEARRAETATLWDLAAERYESFLSLISGTVMASEEAAALTALGRRYWNLSEARTAWRTLRRAIGLYRERGDGIGMAIATLGILRIWGPPDRKYAMATEALELLGDREPLLHALLLLRDWQHEEALALAEQHGFAGILIFRVERAGWETFEKGDIGEALAMFRQVHEFLAARSNYHPAAGVLRGAGFRTLEAGLLDEGEAFSHEAVAYARDVHLRFAEQLALMDLAGVAFALCEFERCLCLIDERPTATRSSRGSLSHVDRGTEGRHRRCPRVDGGSRTGTWRTHGVSQTRAAASGLLTHAGRDDAARHELETWADIAGQSGSLCREAPALGNCLVTLGTDALVRELHEAFEGRTRSMHYATLQGRGDGDLRGAIALRLGKSAVAHARFEEGLAWAERERCSLDAARCLLGLASIMVVEGDDERASRPLDRAKATFERYGARPYLDRVTGLGRR